MLDYSLYKGPGDLQMMPSTSMVTLKNWTDVSKCPNGGSHRAAVPKPQMLDSPLQRI